MAAGLALALAPGIAGASWSAPDTLSSGSGLSGPAGTPTLAFDSRGRALATWPVSFGRRWRLASRAPGASRFGAERAAPQLGHEVVEGAAPAPVLYGADRVVAVQQRKLGPGCGGRARYDIESRFGRSTGAFRPPRRIARIHSSLEPPTIALAGNRRGQALVAWVEVARNGQGRCVRPVREIVRVAVRRSGEPFERPFTLSGARFIRDLAVAVARDAP